MFMFMCMFCRSLFVLSVLATVLSVRHRFTDSDYPFRIFKRFLPTFINDLYGGSLLVRVKSQTGTIYLFDIYVVIHIHATANLTTAFKYELCLSLWTMSWSKEQTSK